MITRKILFAAASLAAAGTLALSATANAATSGIVTYSNAGSNAVAGWFAFAGDSTTGYFTHLNSYLGSAGNSTIENLPVSTLKLLTNNPVPSDNFWTPQPNSGSTINTKILGGFGLGLCDRQTDYGAQIGDVYVGNGLMDVVAATGIFDPSTQQNGDACEGGLVNQGPGPFPGAANPGSLGSIVVLLQGIPVNDTIQVDMQSAPYMWNNHPAHSVSFAAIDLSRPSLSNAADLCLPNSRNPVPSPSATTPPLNGEQCTFTGARFNEADAGVITDTTPAPALNIAVPAPNTGGLESNGLDELVRFAHVKVSANGINGHMSHGNTESPLQNGPWTTYAVAATGDGLPNGPRYLVPSNFGADNFYVAGGLGLINP